MPKTLLCILYFFFNDTATTEIYTLSLHDALPISHGGACFRQAGEVKAEPSARREARSEEHTSELQSHVKLVCRLLLVKKKKQAMSGRRVVVFDSCAYMPGGCRLP